MTDISPSIVIEDSKGNRYFFYYRDFSIYYREVLNTGDTRDTILISQANPDFAAAIDTDDSLYLTCNSRYKGVLLFTYTNLGWKFETVVSINNSTNIYIMDILVQNNSIHIFFSKKLPIANLYNVYHLQKNLNEQVTYIEYSWKKNSISEIYSHNIEDSFSIVPSKGGIINYASIWYDGTYYYINYYCYDDSIKYWIHKSLNISFKNKVAIKLVNHSKRIKLLCYSSDNDNGNIHHFSAKASGGSEIDFRETDNSYVDTEGTVPLFFYDDKSLQLSWIKNNVFHQYTYDESISKWRKALDLPLTAETGIHLLKYIKNSGSVSASKGYFIIDRSYNISRPIEHLSKGQVEETPKESPQSTPTPEMNDYLKQILEEIKGLSNNVHHLNKRMDDMEVGTLVRRQNLEKSEISKPSDMSAPNGDTVRRPLKKSNFKERFMKNEKPPSYEKLLVNQENITTFVGKPTQPKNDADSVQIKETANATDKQAFVPPGQRSGSAANSKSSNLLRKIGEFFK